VLFYKGFSFCYALVTTYYTYPEPIPICRVTALGLGGGRSAKPSKITVSIMPGRNGVRVVFFGRLSRLPTTQYPGAPRSSGIKRPLASSSVKPFVQPPFVIELVLQTSLCETCSLPLVALRHYLRIALS